MAVKKLDQNDRSKGKFLDLETDAEEVLGLEQGCYAVKEGYLHVKWVLNSYRSGSIQG